MLHAVIMAGGRGERFWPYGRRRRPKQFLRLFGEHSLLQQTAHRLGPLVPWERLWIVTTEEYAPQVAEQLPSLSSHRIVVEPEGRNTAPCIALALARIRRLADVGDDDVMAVLPADHWIGDEALFRRLLSDAADVARGTESLVTLGISPTAPETGYGYIEMNAAVAGRGPAGHPYHRVERFVEKPSRDRAEAMLAQGHFMWNSGMFLWRFDALERAFARYLPEVARHLPALGEGNVEGVYGQLPRVSIDVGIMEKADDVIVFPTGNMGWSDVGSWAALGPMVVRDGSAGDGAPHHIAIDSRDCVVFDAAVIEARSGDHPASERGLGDHLIVTLGVDDMVVVRTADATLICPRDRAQDVRDVVRLLEAQGREDLL